MVVVSALLAACALAPAHEAFGASTSAAATGVTRRAVTVGGMVGTDAASVGADIGAQARFARANRGAGVAGRTIEYLRTEATPDAAAADAAAARLAVEVFAVVPAVAPSVGAATLTRLGMPFFGNAAGQEWHAERTGFSVTGAGSATTATVVNPAWPVQLRELLGRPRRATVVPVTDDPVLGAALAGAAGKTIEARFRAAGLPLGAPVGVVPTSDLGAIARAITTTAPLPAVVLVLAAPTTTAAFAHQLALVGYTGTVAVGDAMYRPSTPAIGNGLTVLVPIAPFEEKTAANRRLAADVEAFAPGTALSPAVASGYWSADLFVRALEKTGKTLTRAGLLATMNAGHFTSEVPGTVGRSNWPEMHAELVPCGSLLQGDGARYLVLEPHTCSAAISSTPRE